MFDNFILKTMKQLVVKIVGNTFSFNKRIIAAQKTNLFLRRKCDLMKMHSADIWRITKFMSILSISSTIFVQTGLASPGLYAMLFPSYYLTH